MEAMAALQVYGFVKSRTDSVTSRISLFVKQALKLRFYFVRNKRKLVWSLAASCEISLTGSDGSFVVRQRFL